MEDLKSKFKFAKECFEQKILIDDLLDYFATFLVWVENDPLETVYAQPELKQYFFEEFVGGLAKRLSLLKEASNDVNEYNFDYISIEFAQCEELSNASGRYCCQRDRKGQLRYGGYYEVSFRSLGAIALELILE